MSDSTTKGDAAKPPAEAASSLTAGLTILTAGLGVFGGLSGSVARMARNNQDQTALAIGLVLASVVLAMASRLVPHRAGRRGPRIDTVLLWLALVAFVVGILVAMLTLNTALGEDDRPTVSATTTRGDEGVITVAGKAGAGGLEASDRIYVSAVAFEDLDAEGEQTYYALVGPNQDGLVDHSFSVLLDEGAEIIIISVGKVTRANAESNRSTNLRPQCEPPLPADREPEDESFEKAVRTPNSLTACALVRLPGQAEPAQRAGRRTAADREGRRAS